MRPQADSTDAWMDVACVQLLTLRLLTNKSDFSSIALKAEAVL